MKSSREKVILTYQIIVVLVSMVIYRLADFEHSALGAVFIFGPALIISILSVRFFIKKI